MRRKRRGIDGRIRQCQEVEETSGWPSLLRPIESEFAIRLETDRCAVAVVSQEWCLAMVCRSVGGWSIRRLVSFANSSMGREEWTRESWQGKVELRGRSSGVA